MKDKSIKLYIDECCIGVLRCTSVDVEEDSYLYGGEEKKLFNVYVYYDDVCIFTSIDKKDICLVDNKLYIESFEK